MENILLILFALFLGYMLNRLNIMQRDGSIALNKFVLYVSYPAIVLLQTPKISFSLELMIPAIVAWVVMTLSAFLILFLYPESRLYCIQPSDHFQQDSMQS